MRPHGISKSTSRWTTLKSCSMLQGRHDGRSTERTSHLDGWCGWALNMTAFHPQNWTQCVAPQLTGLTLTILIHKRLRSLTLLVLGTIQTTLKERFQISAETEHVIPVPPRNNRGFSASLRLLDEFSWSMSSRGVHTSTSCERSSHPLSVRLVKKLLLDTLLWTCQDWSAQGNFFCFSQGCY